jgi:ABC-2 type transport system permease protein
MKRYCRLLGVFYRSALLGQMEYRTNFWAGIGMSMLWPIWNVLGIAAFFYHRDTIGGWTFNEVLLVLGLFSVFVGVMEAILLPNIRRMVEHVQNGTLDFVLLKPANSQFLATLTACSLVRLIDSFFGLLVITIGLYRMGYQPTLFQVGAFTVMLLSGVVIIYSMWLLLTTLAFWWVRVDNFTEVFNSFYEAGRFPVTVYSGWIRFVLTFIVPIAFLTTFPAAILLGRLSTVYVGVAVALAAILLIASSRFWKYAIRFYSSASS